MKTISIFLPTGNPNGIKIVELSNRLIKAIFVPRAMLTEAKKRKELSQPALYVLCEKQGNTVYVGESESFFDRIKNHDQNKEFWDIAIAFVSKDNSLEKGDIKYLESVAVEQGTTAGRYILENKTIPPRNNLHEFKQAVVEEFFDDVKLVIAALGYPIFEKVSTEDKDESDYWYCTGRGAELVGFYDENGMTLLSGSLLAPDVTDSFRDSWGRPELIAKLCKSDKEPFRTQEDYTFSSPSAAAVFGIGRSANGWTSWKKRDGKTLDEVMRVS